LGAIALVGCATPSVDPGVVELPVEAAVPVAAASPLVEPDVAPVPRIGAVWRVSGAPTVTRLAAGAELVELSAEKEGRRVGLQVVLFDARNCDLRVVDQAEEWAGAGAIRRSMRSVSAVAGVNGGFFTPEFAPMGLVVADGTPSGVFQGSGLVSGGVGSGVAGPALVWNAEFQAASDYPQFLQAGPRLVNAGAPVPGLSDGRRAARTFVATDGGSRWAVGVLKSSSLLELSEVLVSPRLFWDRPVWRALNLDGGRSSSLWVRREDGEELAWTGWSTVRNFLAIVPR
jgi:hypothetical protein